jgi:hypothetical protein
MEHLRYESVMFLVEAPVTSPGEVPALPTNIRQGWKGLQGTISPAVLLVFSVEKSLITSSPVVNH